MPRALIILFILSIISWFLWVFEGIIACREQIHQLDSRISALEFTYQHPHALTARDVRRLKSLFYEVK